MKKHTNDILDKKILYQLKNGDETAFDYFYWKYNSYIFNFIKSLLFDTSLAEDLTQNVFLKIWEKRENIDPEQDLEAYLFKIARNFVYKETENRLKLICDSSSSGESKDISDNRTEEIIDASFLQEYIDSLIDQLPPARKEIFLLSRRSHLSNKEIVKKLSISEKTVENQISNAIRFLKEKLSEEKTLTLLALLLINKS